MKNEGFFMRISPIPLVFGQGAKSRQGIEKKVVFLREIKENFSEKPYLSFMGVIFEEENHFYGNRSAISKETQPRG